MNIQNKNYRNAIAYFESTGELPIDRKPYTYCMHHKDETLRHSNIDRYLEWRIEDLEIVPFGEHSKEHNIGKEMSESTRKKCGIAGSKHKMSEKDRMNLRKINSKPIICLDNNTVYNSIKDAANELGLQSSNICALLKGHTNSNKWHFKYVKEWD